MNPGSHICSPTYELFQPVRKPSGTFLTCSVGGACLLRLQRGLCRLTGQLFSWSARHSVLTKHLYCAGHAPAGTGESDKGLRLRTLTSWAGRTDRHVNESVSGSNSNPRAQQVSQQTRVGGAALASEVGKCS